MTKKEQYTSSTGPKYKTVICELWNTTRSMSLCSNCLLVNDLNPHIDLFCLTEPWLQQDDYVS